MYPSLLARLSVPTGIPTIQDSGVSGAVSGYGFAIKSGITAALIFIGVTASVRRFRNGGYAGPTPDLIRVRLAATSGTGATVMVGLSVRTRERLTFPANMMFIGLRERRLVHGVGRNSIIATAIK